MSFETTYQNGLKTPPIITDPFGYRIHPIYGDRRLHAGTDSVGHPLGRNYAPRAGTVISATYNGGAGNEVQIRDGQHPSIVWKLMHHASFLVSVGQVVAAGDPTGTTGTTGDSTGVHCHCQGEDNGVPFDVMPWIADRTNPTTPTSNETDDDMFMTFTQTGGAPTAPQGFHTLYNAGLSTQLSIVRDKDGNSEQSVCYGILVEKKRPSPAETIIFNKVCARVAPTVGGGNVVVDNTKVLAAIDKLPTTASITAALNALGVSIVAGVKGIFTKAGS